tara:strand:- start:33333 stop:34067 length:735 start_codon:yes stop_codon:yes gene_type:complete
MPQTILEGPFWDFVDQNADYQDVEQALLELCAPYGVEVISCVEIKTPSMSASPFIGRLIGKRDGEYLRRYRKLELDRHDVAFQHIPHASEGFYWGDVQHLAQTKEQQNVFAIAREHWLSDGFLAPFFGPGGRIGFTGFYGKAICDAPVTRRILEVAGNQFYRYAYRKAASDHQSKAGKTQLTDRQKEVLYWISKGKTDSEMSEILRIARPTVNRHVEMAKEALNVRSRAEAVYLALVNNLISPN